jgi:hypothetical protein
MLFDEVIFKYQGLRLGIRYRSFNGPYLGNHGTNTRIGLITLKVTTYPFFKIGGLTNIKKPVILTKHLVNTGALGECFKKLITVKGF